MHIVCAFSQNKQYSWRPAVITRCEMKAPQNGIQVCISRCSTAASSDPASPVFCSFTITLQLVLHFSEFAPDETLRAVTLSPIEMDHFPPLCSDPVLCLIYCYPVLTDIFTNNCQTIAAQ